MSEKKTVAPESGFRVGSEELSFRLIDFWRWAFSDLKQNALRGTLAEFLVAQATGAMPPSTTGWDGYDLIAPDGTKIEVKCSAYLQAWEQPRNSRIGFSRLKGRAWSPGEGYAADATYRADVFVFCVQTATTHEQYDPLDVGQWEFYVVSARAITSLGLRSFGYTTLRRICPEPVNFDALADAVTAAVATGC